MTGLLGVFGRLHPLVLHLPIGMLAALALLELAIWRGAPVSRRVTGLLAWATAGCALLTAASGYTLSREPGYDSEAVAEHLRFGLGFAACACVLAVLHARAARAGVYRGWLLLTLAVMTIAGDLGARITHGSGFLMEPLHPSEAPAGASDPGSSFATAVQPILQARCTSCHGASKHNGGLSLHTAEAIQRGGKDGLVLVAGQPAQSELMHRLKLPLNDHDHMPPDGKPQPDEAQIALLEAWIAAGAPFEGRVELPGVSQAAVAAAPAPGSVPGAEPGAAAASEPAAASASQAAAPAGPAPADAVALDALRAQLVHVEPVQQGSNLLWIDFAGAAPAAGDELVQSLLSPLQQQLAELSLGRTGVTSAILPLFARMPHLRRLDLRGTAVDDIAALQGHAALEELVLAQTRLSDAAVDTLLAMPGLKRVYLWSAGVTPEAAARLRAQRPELLVDTGDTAATGVVEQEGDLQFTSEAPLPGQEAQPAELKPINSICPVTGNPVNPKYSILHNGRVVGFCCPNCPKEFWADPAKFESKLQ